MDIQHNTWNVMWNGNVKKTKWVQFSTKLLLVLAWSTLEGENHSEARDIDLQQNFDAVIEAQNRRASMPMHDYLVDMNTKILKLEASMSETLPDALKCELDERAKVNILTAPRMSWPSSDITWALKGQPYSAKAALTRRKPQRCLLRTSTRRS